MTGQRISTLSELLSKRRLFTQTSINEMVSGFSIFNKTCDASVFILTDNHLSSLIPWYSQTCDTFWDHYRSMKISHRAARGLTPPYITWLPASFSSVNLSCLSSVFCVFNSVHFRGEFSTGRKNYNLNRPTWAEAQTRPVRHHQHKILSLSSTKPDPPPKCTS